MRAEHAELVSLLEWADHGNLRITNIESGRIEMTDVYGWVEFILSRGPEAHGPSGPLLRTYLSQLHSLGSSFDAAPEHPPQR